jgi:hypothetical protein
MMGKKEMANPDERIIGLTNELLNELEKQGCNYMREDITTGFGCLHIWKHDDGTLVIQNNNFEVRGRRSV